MAKVPLLDVGSLGNPSTARQNINENNERIEDAFDNFISRDGTSPNQMEADFDAGGFRLLNVADPVNDNDGVNRRSVRPLVQEFASDLVGSAVLGTQTVDTATAAAGQTTFPLSKPPGSLQNVEFFVDGLAYRPGIDFTLTGSTLQTVTLLTAPLTLGQKILARYSSTLPLGTADATSVTYDGGVLQDFLDALQAASGGTLLGYQQAGLGAVLQNITKRLQNEVWASDFGAVADFNEGTGAGTDNTAAFAAAIAYLNGIGGGTLKLGRGKYMGRIVVPYSNIVVEGQGQWSTKLFNVGNSAVFEIDCTSTDVQYSGLKEVLIQNRSKPVYTAADGIYLNAPTSATGSSFLIFENVYVFNMRHNLSIRGRTIWNTWLNVNMSGAIQNGLNIDAYDNAAQQLFLNCRFGASAQHGLFLNHTFAGFPTVGWTFIGCTFEHNVLNGCRLTGSISGPQAWKFVNCYWEENTSGISVGGSGGLQKCHVFCDTPEILGISFDGGSMFGAHPGDPAQDYHIYCNTGGAGVYYGEVKNMRFGVATINDVFFAKNMVLGKNFYSSGTNADPSLGSFVLDSFLQASGTFTPSLTFGGAGVGMTYGNRKGQWVRHGNIVHFTIYISLSAKGSSTGQAKIQGLPMVSTNVANLYQAVSLHADQLQSGVLHAQARIIPNTADIELGRFATGTNTNLADTDFGNFSAITVSGTYLVR